MRKPSRQWSGWLAIDVVMPRVEDLSRGMEIATKFEDWHGGHPPMYFLTIPGINTIRIVANTGKNMRLIARKIKRLGALAVTASDRGAGHRENCHMYQVAKHLDGKPPSDVVDCVHLMHRMLNYTLSQELRNYLQLADFLTTFVVRPHEKR